MKKQAKQQAIASFKRWSRRGYGVLNTLHCTVRIGVLSVAMSIISSVANEASANTPDTTLVSKVVELDEVGILLEKQTPTRSTMSSAPIFDRAVEAAAPLQTLESALRLSPSVDLRERGGKGVQADISIRGGSFDQTMVMLNGINFTDARTGHQTHSLPIDIEQLAAIEVIDGIAGVGAYAGAINFRTAPLRDQYLRVEASGGDFGYAYGNLSGAYTHKELTIFGAGSYRRSDGYRDNTEFDNYNAYTRATYDSESLGFFDFQAGFQDRAFAANGFYSLKFPDQFESTRTYLTSLRWFKHFGNLRLNASANYRQNSDCFELIKGQSDKVPFNYHLTDNSGAELWADYSWVGGRTTLGADIAYNYIRSTVLGEKLDVADGIYTHAGDRLTANYYLRHTKNWDKAGVSAAAGVSSTPYGISYLWNIAANYQPTNRLRFEAGATQAMRLPTFTDLYYTSTGYISNPDLQPEKAITYRLNGRYTIDNFNVSALAYLRDGSNTIDWVRASAQEDWRSEQITDLTTIGAELMANYMPRGFVHRISASYGYITMDKQSNNLISKYATDYMHNKGALSIEMRFLSNFALTVTGSVYDRMGNYSDLTGETLPYKPYGLVDARLSWERNSLKIYVDGTNLGSTQYFDYGGLPMPGAWVSGGVVFTL